MDTLPMPLDTLASSHGGLSDFRVSSPTEVLRLLKTLCSEAVPMNFNAANGAAVASRLWTVDAEHGLLGFAADAEHPQLQSLLDCDEAVVVGWLESVKLQFDVQGLLLVRNGAASTLRCPVPREMWRFQRRNAFRVRPLRQGPTARLRHPEISEMQLSLRVLDISIGGCALFLPEDVPGIEPGVQMNAVRLTLDADTALVVDLRLHHVTGLNADAGGVRLGCELVRPSGSVERTLQQYIDQTEKRRRLMARA